MCCLPGSPPPPPHTHTHPIHLHPGAKEDWDKPEEDWTIPSDEQADVQAAGKSESRSKATHKAAWHQWHVHTPHRWAPAAAAKKAALVAAAAKKKALMEAAAAKKKALLAAAAKDEFFDE